MSVVKTFEEFGFTPHASCGKTKRVLSSHCIGGEYEGVYVEFPSDTSFILKSGDIKYFGSIVLPEMSTKSRSMGEIKRMLEVMLHYHEVIERNPPW